MQGNTQDASSQGWTVRLVAVGIVSLGLLVLALLVGLAVLFLKSPSAQPSPGSSSALTLNQAAPDVALDMLGGKTVRLSSLRGRPVWINFWASWCTPCRAEMPHILQVAGQPGSGNVQLLAVSTGEGEETVRGYLKRSGYTELPAALDTDGSVATRYHVHNLPTHVFIDSDGIVREVRLGTMEADEMQAAVKRLR